MPNMMRPISFENRGAMSRESGNAISQLRAPCKTPSIINIRITVPERAPMARRIPISFVRSMTLIESAPICPMPPTSAARNAIAMNI
jgi:hypothetical protein